jgi:hypothetical protein
MRKIIVLWTLIWVLAIWHSESFATVCPLVQLECIDAVESIPDRYRFEESGAASWEIVAWEAISSGNIGKGPTDVIKWRAGQTDLGYFHLNHAPSDERVLGTGLVTSDGWRGEWVDWALAMLYWDRAEGNYALQLEEWRRIVKGPVAEAHRNGCRRRCKAVVAGIANSSPVLARTLGRESDWEPEYMLDEYANSSGRHGRGVPSRHRRMRAEFLRGRL